MRKRKIEENAIKEAEELAEQIDQKEERQKIKRQEEQDSNLFNFFF